MNSEPAATGFPNHWREVWIEMQREWDRLHLQIAQLQSERDQLSKALVALLHEDSTLNEKEILAQIGKEKPLREFLQELRGQLVVD